MKPIYNALRLDDLKALAIERGLRDSSRLRKPGLIDLLQNNQVTNYESMNLAELKALVRERRLRAAPNWERLSWLPLFGVIRTRTMTTWQSKSWKLSPENTYCRELIIDIIYVLLESSERLGNPHTLYSRMFYLPLQTFRRQYETVVLVIPHFFIKYSWIFII